jgi:NADH-quinone oxidoreductase subunit L
MFRLVYLAFFGQRREAPAAAHGHGADDHGHGAHGNDAHGHGGHLHDAPPAMAFALVILAVGAILAGYVGVPKALGGGERFDHYLAPSFQAPTVATVEGGIALAVPTTPAPETAAAAVERPEPAEESSSTEMALMGVSVAAGLGGIALASFIWLGRPAIADSLAESMSGIYHLLLGKYYVDEIYNAVIVQPIKRVSSFFLWKGLDAGLIDGTVNSVGFAVRGSSAVLRRFQTGSVRAYAMSLFVGVVAIVGYFLWR